VSGNEITIELFGSLDGLVLNGPCIVVDELTLSLPVSYSLTGTVLTVVYPSEQTAFGRWAVRDWSPWLRNSSGGMLAPGVAAYSGEPIPLPTLDWSIASVGASTIAIAVANGGAELWASGVGFGVVLGAFTIDSVTVLSPTELELGITGLPGSGDEIEYVFASGPVGNELGQFLRTQTVMLP
jgi:hypothetical protein